MKKILLLSLIMLSTVSFATTVDRKGVTYDFQIIKILDGDTVKFEAPFLPQPLKKELSLRVYGVDTPEKGARAKCPKEDERGKAATKYTATVVNQAQKRQIVIMEWDKFGGRVLGDVILDGKSLRQLLITNGFAREYYGEAKQSWCN